MGKKKSKPPDDESPATRSKRAWGKAVIAALKDHYGENLLAMEAEIAGRERAAAVAAGLDPEGMKLIAYSTLQDWTHGYVYPSLELLERIVAVTPGTTVLGLLSGGEAALRRERPLRDHPEWPSAVAAARAMYGNRLQPVAFELAGDRTWPPPGNLSPETVYDAAAYWAREATNDEIKKAETAMAKTEMDEKP